MGSGGWNSRVCTCKTSTLSISSDAIACPFAQLEQNTLVCMIVYMPTLPGHSYQLFNQPPVFVGCSEGICRCSKQGDVTHKKMDGDGVGASKQSRALKKIRGLLGWKSSASILPWASSSVSHKLMYQIY